MVKLYKTIVCLSTYSEKSITPKFNKKWQNDMKDRLQKFIPRMLKGIKDFKQNLIRNPLDKISLAEGKNTS